MYSGLSLGFHLHKPMWENYAIYVQRVSHSSYGQQPLIMVPRNSFVPYACYRQLLPMKINYYEVCTLEKKSRDFNMQFTLLYIKTFNFQRTFFFSCTRNSHLHSGMHREMWNLWFLSEAVFSWGNYVLGLLNLWNLLFSIYRLYY